MKPWEFGALTPREFNALLDGWLWRHQQQREDTALWVSTLINTLGHRKRKVTPAELLGHPVGNQPLGVPR